jgi:DNA invertase Pin-like site-specific DNA recombinase
VAYSYIRFSTPEQAAGDSLRRQTEEAEDYCRRHGLTLDESLTLRDLGVSAFRGKNALVGNLRTFLDAVARGTVPPGSVLIVESVDRISRQGIDEGYDILKGILKKGVSIVTLSPEREFGPEAVKSLTKGALELQIILERAAEESERKSDRNGKAWAQKVKVARAGGEILTQALPAWVEATGGKWVEDRHGKKVLRGARLTLIPERAEVVRRIFWLAANGYGMASIVQKLTADGVEAWGRSKVWVRAYVAKILKDRRAIGEHQPKGKGRKPNGDVIPNYFPAVVTEEEFYAARAGCLERLRKPGRIGDHVNVFAGILFNARDGDKWFSTKLAASKGGYRVLVNTAGTEGRAKSESFPLDVFEQAVLSELREIDPHEVLNGDHGPDESLAIAAELAGVEAKIAELEAELANGDVAALARVLRQQEERQRDLAARLAEARQKALHPLSETWGETKSLIEALTAAPDPVEARLRLRSALRRITDSVWLLVVVRGLFRIAAVQVWFKGGKVHRDYVILYQPRTGNASSSRPAQTWTKSVKWEGRRKRDLDLRDPKQARELAALLESIDPTEWDLKGLEGT